MKIECGKERTNWRMKKYMENVISLFEVSNYLAIKKGCLFCMALVPIKLVVSPPFREDYTWV
jgi:hypothetical protein